MKIKEFSARVGLSESAIRYYERIGILMTVGRLANRYREFDSDDVEWMEFVIRLRNTGMPIGRIVEFSRLRALGTSTLPERKEMLQEHERRLVHEIEEKAESLRRLREKITLYEKS